MLYKLDNASCLCLLLFYQNMEASQENKIHLEDGNIKQNAPDVTLAKKKRQSI